MLIVNIWIIYLFLSRKVLTSITSLVPDNVSCHVSVQFIYSHLLERDKHDTIKPSAER